jgi:hypothetical protein
VTSGPDGIEKQSGCKSPHDQAIDQKTPVDQAILQVLEKA